MLSTGKRHLFFNLTYTKEYYIINTCLECGHILISALLDACATFSVSKNDQNKQKRSKLKNAKIASLSLS